MRTISLHSLRRWRRLVPVLAAVLVAALLVVAQDMHVPGSHDHAAHAMAEQPAAPAGPHTDAGTDAPHAGTGDCSGAVCSLCLALTPAATSAPPAAGLIRAVLQPRQPLPARAERPYRPPIHSA
ncbi:MAG: hypothetical protein U5K33_09195 [Halofilum sp. (in: g-proteobacteria)]|nr:hypothetical protein [Halofilum sp. (in: g-proteobacteria)]